MNTETGVLVAALRILANDMEDALGATLREAADRLEELDDALIDARQQMNTYHPDLPAPPDKRNLKRHVATRQVERFCWTCGKPIEVGQVYYSLIMLDWWDMIGKYIACMEHFCEGCEPKEKR